MIPFLTPSGGNCQDAVILVEVLAVALKLPGGPEGTDKSSVMIRYFNELTFTGMNWKICKKSVLN